MALKAKCMMYCKHYYRMLFVLMLSAACAYAYAGEPSLWQQGLASSAERILVSDHEQIRLEQEIRIDDDIDQVWNILTDLQQYPLFYPLFDEIDVHASYQSGAYQFSEFTAYHYKRVGQFSLEQRFFGIMRQRVDSQQLDLSLWQQGGAFYHLQITLRDDGLPDTLLAITTDILAEKSMIAQAVNRELLNPVFQGQVFKLLLEEGVSVQRGCMMQNRSDHFCF